MLNSKPESYIIEKVNKAIEVILIDYDSNNFNLDSFSDKVSSYMYDNVDLTSSQTKFTYREVLEIIVNNDKLKLLKENVNYYNDNPSSLDYNTLFKIRCCRYEFLNYESLNNILKNPYLTIKPWFDFSKLCEPGIRFEKAKELLRSTLYIIYKEDVLSAINSYYCSCIVSYKLSLVNKNFLYKIKRYFLNPLNNNYLWITISLIFIAVHLTSIFHPLLEVKNDSQQTVALSIVGAITSLLGFLVVFLQLSFENLRKVYGDFVKSIYINKDWTDIVILIVITLFTSFIAAITKESNEYLQDFFFNSSLVFFVALIIMMLYKIKKIISASMSTTEIEKIINEINYVSISKSYRQYNYHESFKYKNLDLILQNLSNIVYHNLLQTNSYIINAILGGLYKQVRIVCISMSSDEYKAYKSITWNAVDYEGVVTYITSLVQNLMYRSDEYRSDQFISPAINTLQKINKDMAFLNCGFKSCTSIFTLLEYTLKKTIYSKNDSDTILLFEVLSDCIHDHLEYHNSLVLKSKGYSNEDVLELINFFNNRYTYIIRLVIDQGNMYVLVRFLSFYGNILNALHLFKFFYTQDQIQEMMQNGFSSIVSYYLEFIKDGKIVEFDKEIIKLKTVTDVLISNTQYSKVPFKNFIYWYKSLLFFEALGDFPDLYLIRSLFRFICEKLYVTNKILSVECSYKIIELYKEMSEKVKNVDYPSRYNLFIAIKANFSACVSDMKNNNIPILINSSLFKMLSETDSNLKVFTI